MSDDGSEAAARQLLRERPGCAFFYLIYLDYSTGSTGDASFHAIATDPQRCRETIGRLCAEQKAACAREVAELEALPEDEQPYDPLLPSGCSATLCLVLPDGARYVPMQSQRWSNEGWSGHPAHIPDIFDIASYSDRLRQGAYRHDRIRGC